MRGHAHAALTTATALQALRLSQRQQLLVLMLLMLSAPVLQLRSRQWTRAQRSVRVRQPGPRQ